ncbi:MULTISPECIES: class I SAM-dependent methyltransferase [unclassified Thiocapsa]|uniref:class I SAM-dependent methyltransferase n=1 Tax=unclassified Thiocapsa TaxID=2641286 RepID=UPI0035B37D56
MTIFDRAGRTLQALPLVCRYPRGFRIPSHLTLAERAVLYRLAEGVPHRPVLEIGSYLGASAYFLAAARDRAEYGGRVICIDTWQNDAMTEGARDTFAQFLANTRAFTGRITPLRGFSHEVVKAARALAPEGIGMLFIDGDHSWESVRRDWDCYRHLLGPGAVVALHDIGWAEGVQRVVREEVEPLVDESGALPNLWWGTMAR